jgi:hypothetical protein
MMQIKNIIPHSFLLPLTFSVMLTIHLIKKLYIFIIIYFIIK